MDKPKYTVHIGYINLDSIWDFSRIFRFSYLEVALGYLHHRTSWTLEADRRVYGIGAAILWTKDSHPALIQLSIEIAFGNLLLVCYCLLAAAVRNQLLQYSVQPSHTRYPHVDKFWFGIELHFRSSSLTANANRIVSLIRFQADVVLQSPCA